MCPQWIFIRCTCFYAARLTVAAVPVERSDVTAYGPEKASCNSQRDSRIKSFHAKMINAQ